MPAAGNCSRRKNFIDGGKLVRVQRNIRCCGISFQIGDLVGPWNRHEKIALMENPGQRQLRDGAIFRTGKLFQLFEQIDVALKVLLVKTRPAPLRFLLAQIREVIPFAA